MMHLITTALRAWAIALVCIATGGLAMVNPTTPTTSRRALLGRLPFVVIGATTAISTTTVTSTSSQRSNECDENTGNCQCLKCRFNWYQNFSNNNMIVNAYERRDVGGANASAETKAMNDQAYETNNRLERDGLILETAAEQSTKLTAALSEYSYSPTPGKAVAPTSKSSRGSKKKEIKEN